MIPAALGNIVGGDLFVGVLYGYLFLLGDDVVIHFDNAPLDVSADRVLPDSGNGPVSSIVEDLHGAQYKREASSNNRVLPLRCDSAPLPWGTTGASLKLS
jgi:hypothetical protein